MTKEKIMTQIFLKRVRDNQDLPLPAYQSEFASGMDLRADVREDIIIKSGERGLIPTGLAMAIEPGFEVQIRPRSGLALKNGVTVLNAPGTIDSDYRGEVQVILINHGDADFVIKRGDRIAQMIVASVAQAKVLETTELPETARAAGGFGSTGKC